MGEGLVVPAGGKADGREITVDDRVGAFDGEAARQQVDRFVLLCRPSHLVNKQTEVEEGLGVVRGLLRDGAVEGLRLVQPAGALEIESGPQSLLDRGQAMSPYSRRPM